jgi:hypothetical protein
MNLKKPQFWLLIFAAVFFILTPVFHYKLDKSDPTIPQLAGYGKGTALGLSVILVLISLSLSLNDKTKGQGMTKTDYVNMSVCISNLLVFIVISVVNKIDSPWLLGLALYGALASASQLIQEDVE